MVAGWSCLAQGPGQEAVLAVLHSARVNRAQMQAGRQEWRMGHVHDYNAPHGMRIIMWMRRGGQVVCLQLACLHGSPAIGAPLALRSRALHLRPHLPTSPLCLPACRLHGCARSGALLGGPGAGMTSSDSCGKPASGSAAAAAGQLWPLRSSTSHLPALSQLSSSWVHALHTELALFSVQFHPALPPPLLCPLLLIRPLHPSPRTPTAAAVTVLFPLLSPPGNPKLVTALSKHHTQQCGVGPKAGPGDT